MAMLNYNAVNIGSKDVGARGILQTHLTTIELGFAPFIPMTETYIQQALVGRSDTPFNPP